MVDDELWGERVAARYDSNLGGRGHDEVVGQTVAALAELAGGGSALEFAIGTGRIGLPLQRSGVTVHGIELSEPMVSQLRAKPGGGDLPVTIGDMATIRLDVEFSLVYLVFNTITNLLTQDEQVACFENAAAHLVPGGRFVVEVGLPPAGRRSGSERFVPFDVSDTHVGIDEYDVTTQRLVSHHLYIDGDTVQRIDSPHRYAWPAEYDLMARIAGMTLEHRWSDWDRSAFTADSDDHVSVWSKR